MKLALVTDYHTSRPEQVGNKAHTLFRLADTGIQVPATVALSADFLAKLSKESPGEIPWLPEWTEEVFTRLGSNRIAVRSSGVDEDGAGQSFAGQFESVLDVTRETFTQALATVWKSANAERVQSYRQQHGIRSNHGFAIILQEMVPASVAGVAFSVDPVSGNPSKQVINAVTGLGDRLVSGEVSGEHIEIIQGEPGPSKLLSAEDQRTLSNTVKQLEQLLGGPQDVEFAFHDRVLFILQSRPITALPNTGEEAIIWDNSNIIESFPGLTSPLTFSFIITVYEKAYRQLLRLLGASQRDLEDHSEVFANTLGLIHGRVYYNLYAWYKMLSLLPGYSLNKGFMEKMMGVKETFELKDHRPMSGFVAWTRILAAAVKIIRNFMTLGRSRKQFLHAFHQELRAIRTLDFESQSLLQMRDTFLSFETRIISKWKAPLVNDFFTMILFGILQKMLEKKGLKQLHNDLLIGSRDIVSVQPALRIAALVKTIRANTALQSVFESEVSDQEVLQRLPETDTNFHAAFEHYIADFGNRCGEELKLETITYETQPTKLIGVLRGHLRSKHMAVPADTATVRKEAEEKALAHFSHTRVFRYVLRKTRELVSNRENLRYERTKAFAIGRSIFRAIGSKLHQAGHISALDDVFYLTKTEIFEFIDGKPHPLKELVAQRKVEYDSYKKEHLPERIIETDGTLDLSTGSPVEQGDLLQGIGCCPGVIRGTALLVESPNADIDLEGKVMLAQSTDPGWVTLFASAQGMVVERGSLLSHSAIVAREMGIPCVVNIPHLFQRIRTGDEIEMNGRTGTVRILRATDE